MIETSITDKIIPFSLLIGQEKLKLALKLTYIAPRIGGVLLSGQRGTGKSTAVRAFSLMTDGKLPVTLPINATEDRIVGGLDVDKLMEGKSEWKDGLLKEADGELLYIDEVNLLDDHIVNIILDVSSTGVLIAQRDGRKKQEAVSFRLIGTMNPEEGGLRPQLLDRFGLMVDVTAETGKKERIEILNMVMKWDEAMFEQSQGKSSDYIEKARLDDQKCKDELEKAKQKFQDVKISKEMIECCVKLTDAFNSEGNRGDYIIALASRACAALEKDCQQVQPNHIQKVAQLVLQHRRPGFLQSNQLPWTENDDNKVKEILAQKNNS